MHCIDCIVLNSFFVLCGNISYIINIVSCRMVLITELHFIYYFVVFALCLHIAFVNTYFSYQQEFSNLVPNLLLQTHALSSNEVTCLEYWPPLLIAGTSEGSILVWDLNTEKLVHRFVLVSSVILHFVSKNDYLF